jgi:hypothetical protein
MPRKLKIEGEPILLFSMQKTRLTDRPLPSKLLRMLFKTQQILAVSVVVVVGGRAVDSCRV